MNRETELLLIKVSPKDIERVKTKYKDLDGLNKELLTEYIQIMFELLGDLSYLESREEEFVEIVKISLIENEGKSSVDVNTDNLELPGEYGETLIAILNRIVDVLFGKIPSSEDIEALERIRELSVED